MAQDTLRLILERFDSRSFLDSRVVVELTKSTFQCWSLVAEPLAGAYGLLHETRNDLGHRVVLSAQFNPRECDLAGDAQHGDMWQDLIDAAGHDWACSADLVRIRMEYPDR